MDPQVSHTFEELRQICRRLRAPGGCPWDREQTISSLTPYLLEETHEVLEAIESDEAPRLREELGDLLYLIVFVATIAEEERRLRFDDVIAGIIAKLIRRHPRVFGSEAPPAGAVPGEGWEEAKRAEKRSRGDRRGTLASGAASLPALLEAFRVQEKAAGFGFDWPHAEAVLEKLDEEREELAQALAARRADASTQAAVRDELGDLLFTLVNLSRRLGEDPERLLKRATRKFQERFHRMERILEGRGPGLRAADLDTMESAWRQAKSELASDAAEQDAAGRAAADHDAGGDAGAREAGGREGR